MVASSGSPRSDAEALPLGLVHEDDEEELRLGTLRELRIAAMRLAVPVVLVHRRRAHLSGAARALLALLTDSRR